MMGGLVIRPGLNIVIDGQWGSTGKGKLCGWLGKHHSVDFACSSFGPNAGHTYVDENGIKTVLKCFPSTAITARCPILIMPDSVIDITQFWKEREMLDVKVMVHPHTVILEQSDKEAAAVTGRRIAGTMQGTGHAISRKLLRMEGVRLAKDVLPSSYIFDTCQYVQEAIAAGQTGVFEISQGFDLSLNHGWQYPYVTSRDITVGAVLNSAGVPASAIAAVVGSIRTFPIRVGNVEGGHSGPCYPDQHELTWAEVATDSGGPSGLVEMTTVTGRVRRVFTFSFMQIDRFIRYNDPDVLFLNFAQYLDWKGEHVTEWETLPEIIRNFIRTLESHTGVPVWLIGTGDRVTDMVETK